MTDPLKASLAIAGLGLEAQSQRMRVVSQNIANVNTTGSTPGDDPYQRKTITFVEALDRASGVMGVKVARTGVDDSPFTLFQKPLLNSA